MMNRLETIVVLHRFQKSVQVDVCDFTSLGVGAFPLGLSGPGASGSGSRIVEDQAGWARHLHGGSINAVEELVANLQEKYKRLLLKTEIVQPD